MVFDSDQVTTITFDSYSTLVDVDAVEKVLADHIEDPVSISKLWRSRSLEYAMVSNEINAYQSFYEMNRDALQYALSAFGVDLSEDRQDDILGVYHELDVFDDVRDGMQQLSEMGYDLYIVSNGNPEMLDSLVDHADIGELLEDTISAHEVEMFKPAAEIYRHAAARTGTPITDIAHVSSGWLDVQGGMHAGMQGVWEPV